jgi:two-component SAPR family response regulator
MVDDIKPIVKGGVSTLQEVMPNATVTGFTKAADAIEYAKANHVALAFLDIDLGGASGLDLCRTLLEINPRTNVVYLTAFPDYALPAWESKACGFIVKPLTPEKVRLQLEKLRYPISFGSSGGEDL